MTVKLVFSIYDTKAEFYSEPFYMHTTPEAIRAFQSSASDPSHPFSKHPGDYVLCEIGAFDTRTAKFKTKDAVHLGSARDFSPKAKITSLAELPDPTAADNDTQHWSNQGVLTV